MHNAQCPSLTTGIRTQWSRCGGAQRRWSTLVTVAGSSFMFLREPLVLPDPVEGRNIWTLNRYWGTKDDRRVTTEDGDCPRCLEKPASCAAKKVAWIPRKKKSTTVWLSNPLEPGFELAAALPLKSVNSPHADDAPRERRKFKIKSYGAYSSWPAPWQCLEGKGETDIAQMARVAVLLRWTQTQLIHRVSGASMKAVGDWSCFACH